MGINDEHTAIIFLVYLLIYLYAHTLFGPSLPPAPHLLLLLHNPSLSGRTYSALFSNFDEEKT
jgi:hypothetical protein